MFNTWGDTRDVKNPGFLLGKRHSVEFDDVLLETPVIKDDGSGWWFGCHEFYFPINIGFLIIPTDFHIFQRGSNHQPVKDYGLSVVEIRGFPLDVMKKKTHRSMVDVDGFCIYVYVSLSKAR